jgi:predicted kinase
MDRRRPTATERGYDSKWAKARAGYLLKHPRCKMCDAPASVVDHRIPHRGDTALFWEKNNWQALCTSCHSKRKQMIENRPLSADAERRRNPFISPPRMPVVIVCGPAGAGKSTYVRKHAGPNDLVIDLDEIRARISGKGVHAYAPEHLAAALDERNRLLASLAADTTHDRCWFIVSAPTEDERQLWAKKLKARIVLLDTPLAECEKRIRRDPSRVSEVDRMIRLAADWWGRHQADIDSEARGERRDFPCASPTGARRCSRKFSVEIKNGKAVL